MLLEGSIMIWKCFGAGMEKDLYPSACVMRRRAGCSLSLAQRFGSKMSLTLGYMTALMFPSFAVDVHVLAYSQWFLTEVSVM